MYIRSAFFGVDAAIQDALESLALHTNGITLYSAGLPTYPANFTRDGILSAILMADAKMLRDQLTFSAILQGRERNKYTGEEPGKIFHESPPVQMQNLSTEFNACDTTALFLYGHEIYLNLTGDADFIKRQKNYLENAVEYILSHLVNNLFVEDPKYSGARRFALRVTYWKDSQIANRENGLPVYPAVFTLAHIQNMRALKSAALLLDSPDLLTRVHEMKKSLTIFYSEKLGVFHTGIDQRGFFPGISSDNLHLLYYLEPDEIAPHRLASIFERTQILETSFGYLTANTLDESLKGDITKHTGYHTNTVWPFEQAFIHIGAKKFGLEHVAGVASRIRPHLETFPELFLQKADKFTSGGTHTQLWTIAARYYFEHSNTHL